MIRQFKIKINDIEHAIEIRDNTLFVDEVPFVLGTSGDMVTLDGIAYDVKINDKTAIVDGMEFRFESTGSRVKNSLQKTEPAKKSKAKASEKTVPSVMPGAILRVLVREGDKVESGTVLMILEAMKMENEIQTERSGVIKKIYVSPGDKVEFGQPLLDFE